MTAVLNRLYWHSQSEKLQAVTLSDDTHVQYTATDSKFSHSKWASLKGTRRRFRKFSYSLPRWELDEKTDTRLLSVR